MLNADSVNLLCANPWIIRRRLRDEADLGRFPNIAGAKLITLDVFETALARTLAHHDDVFALASWRGIRRLALDSKVEDLVAARRAAHRLALDAARAAGRAETTIEEIYAHHSMTDESVRAALLAEELATERDVCVANPRILALHRELTTGGARVAFLSDTPFSAEFVRALLRDAGYAGELEIYVSSAFGMTKAQGDLYRDVAAAAGVSPASHWHIGDNLGADVVRAKSRGVSPLWYRPRLRKTHAAPAGGSDASIARSVLDGTRAALGLARPSARATIGAAVAGPVYLAFAQWLMRHLAQDPVSRVFFLARDAFVLKAVYERLADPEREPPFNYLVVSRRSLVFPLIERLGGDELDFLVSHERPLPVEEFFARVGLDATPHTAHAERLGLPLDKLVATPADVAALRALFLALEPLVLEHASRERALLLRYLAQEGFSAGQRLALCDVGWNGKSQRALAKVLAAQGALAHLDGYYVGTSEAMRRLGAMGGTASGWLVDDGRPVFGIDVSNLSWVLMELLFSAPHASVIRYTETEGRIAPVYRAQQADADFQAAVAEIQAGALLFVDAYKRAFGGLPPLAVDQAEAARELGRLVATPTLAEAEALGDVTMIEGLGDTRTGYKIAAPPTGRAGLHPGALAAGYRKAMWRRGFAVRVVRSRTIVDALHGGLERLRALRGATAARPMAARPRVATQQKSKPIAPRLGL